MLYINIQFKKHILMFKQEGIIFLNSAEVNYYANSSIQYMMYVFIKTKIPKKACLVYKSDLDSFNTSFIHKMFPAYSILRDIIYSINTNSSFLILNFFFFFLHWVLIAACGIFTVVCRIFHCSPRA